MKVAATVDVRPADPDRVVRTLSGGNQQKIVLARWLLRQCRVLLLDEPTRGVDVGARSEIYLLIRKLADSGVAVVVVSSEVEEVLGLSDRVLVVAAGRVLHRRPGRRDRREPGPRPDHGRNSGMTEKSADGARLDTADDRRISRPRAVAAEMAPTVTGESSRRSLPPGLMRNLGSGHCPGAALPGRHHHRG